MPQWDALVNDFVSNHHEQFTDDIERRYTARRRVDLIGCPEFVLASASNNVTDGEKRLQKAEQLLEHGPPERDDDDLWGRHFFERWFHSMCLIALAELLVGSDWAAVGADIARRRKWTHLGKLVLGMAPRRFGKSVAVAKMIAVVSWVLLVMRKGMNLGVFNIAVFSTGQRASILLMQYTLRFVTEMGLSQYITRSNQENIELQIGILFTRDHLTLHLKFLPASLDRYVPSCFFFGGRCVWWCHSLSLCERSGIAAPLSR